jgi:chemotaxis protein CheD
MISTLSPPATCHLVGMAQIAVFSAPEVARAVLGSCVGVAIYDEFAKLAAVAHVVLPHSEGRATPQLGKYANTAIASMHDSLIKRGANPKRLSAKIAGGANMFVGKGPFQIGDQNISAVRAGLSAHSIRLLAEHVGGTNGRRVTFDPLAGTLLIEISDQASIRI